MYEMSNNEKENKESIDNMSKDHSDTTIIDNPKVSVKWTPENEMIMVEWCDVAQCYKWLNSRSHSKYSYMHAWFTIPAIIFSTISGTASFAQSSIPTNFQPFAPLIIGSINIFIGILTTIQQYLKISELNEAHRVSSIAWDKFARNIRIELSKHPDERTDAKTFIKICRQEFDRLMETSPDIIASVISEFNSAFVGKEGTKKRLRFEQLKKPDICDTIISANEIRHKWYKALENAVSEDDPELELLNKESLIQEQKRGLEEKERELNALNDLENTKMKKQLDNMRISQQQETLAANFYKEQSKLIEEYVSTFIELYERKPLQDEIIVNLSESVDENVLNTFLKTYDIELV
jgi:hypothetical protein|tara:strand:- start:730 stop:1779 length:1050 start_codon:yes stop_codon:yes gene_type:complete